MLIFGAHTVMKATKLQEESASLTTQNPRDAVNLILEMVAIAWLVTHYTAGLVWNHLALSQESSALRSNFMY